MKREAKFTILFRHWLRVNRMHSAAFELKQTTTERLPFSSVQEHQLDALRAAKHLELTYKIPDDSRNVKPFDMVHLNHADAFVVIKYPDEFVLIDVDDFIREKEESPEKSLSAQRAVEIASIHIRL